MGRQIVTRAATFRYLLPSKFATQVQKPAGITALLPDDKRMRLAVQGEKDAVELLLQMAQLADVKPLKFRLDLSLVRIGPGARRSVVEKKTLTVENKGGFSATFGQALSQIQGTLHGSPEEVQLRFTALALRNRQATESVEATRRVPFGKTVAIARLSDPATGPRPDKKPTPVQLVIEATASRASILLER